LERFLLPQSTFNVQECPQSGATADDLQIDKQPLSRLQGDLLQNVISAKECTNLAKPVQSFFEFLSHVSSQRLIRIGCQMFSGLLEA
jgi:hypothetical protein